MASAALFASAAVGGLAALSFADESYFRAIGRAPDNSLPNTAFGFSRAYGISGDGTTVVGSYNSGSAGETPFVLPLTDNRFTRLPGIGGNDRAGEARAATLTGNVIVGRLLRQGAQRAARWTRVGSGYSPTLLGPVGGVTPEIALDVSATGNVIVGSTRRTSFGSGYVAGPGAESMLLPVFLAGEDATTIFANGVSADGNEVAGFGRGGTTGNQIAVRWRKVSPSTYVANTISTGTNIRLYDSAQGISADGVFAVGSIQRPPFPSGFTTPIRAARNTTPQAVGPVGQFGLPLCRAASGDGSVIVGDWGFSGSAFIWNATDGFQFLQDVATDTYGLNLTGWHLDSATGISDDGRTIVGRGTNPFGWEEGFVLFLGVPPGGCPADWDGDDDVDSDDIVAFFRDFDSGNGDFDGDDDTDSDDIAGFFTSWEGGC